MMDLYPDLPEMNPEELAELRTLGQIVRHMESRLAGGGAVAPHPAPVPEAVPAVPPASAGGARAGAVPGIEALSASLLAVVSEKTGYPAEMLELDMEMEADLGIDSIKRVEILGSMMDLYPDLPEMNPEELAELRTLGQIVRHMESRLAGGARGSEGSETAPGAQPARGPSAAEEAVRQASVRLKRLPPPDCLECALPERHICLVTDDGTSMTVGLAEALVKKGWKTVILSLPPSTVPEGPPAASAIPRFVLGDLTENHLKDTLQQIVATEGPIGGLLHLHPPFRGGGEEEGILFSEASRDCLLHVFLMAKHLQPALTRTEPPGRRFFMTVARLDGSLGLRGEGFGVVDGGLFGLVKTLNVEWRSVFCRAVDLSPKLDDERAVRSVLGELQDPDARIVETGYGEEGRVTLVEEPIPPRPCAEGGVLPDRSSVFVVSGGARGVTAACVVALARACKNKFVLLGRSPFTEEEPDWAEGCSDPTELKRRAMEELMARGDRPTPKKIEEILKPVLAGREIGRTLSAIRAAGAEAEYLQADVTDAAAMARVGPAVGRLGRLAGVIHGAGVLADRLIEQKTIGDFQAVYSTKVEGLEALLRSLDSSRLKYLILFSSAAGFYGNPGQSDYAVANEILNKFAHRFKRSHPGCRVRSFNWGPWDGGMVTDSLKRHFEERRIRVIPLQAGARVFVDGFSSNGADCPQILVGGSLGGEGKGKGLPPRAKRFRIVRELKRKDNPFLEDHIIGGHPVIPAAFVMSWMAEACGQFYPEYAHVRLENYDTLKGIVVDHAVENQCVMDVEELPRDVSGQVSFQVQVSRHAEGKRLPHYRARISLVSACDDAPSCPLADSSPSEWLDGRGFYEHGKLFHGPPLQILETVFCLTPERLLARGRLPRTEENWHGKFGSRMFNPRLADALFQAMVVWVWDRFGSASLPGSVLLGEQFRSLPHDLPFHVAVDVKKATKTRMVADVFAHDDAGLLYARLLDAEVIISRSLNRQFRRAQSR
jgi:polyketide-type polyunsaturated fatty acid synthase PfaA